MKKVLTTTGIIGIRSIKITLLISIVAYLIGRLFYTPETYCYIDKVGFRPKSECDRIQKFNQKLPQIYENTQDAINILEMWYYDAWRDKYGKDFRDY